MPEILRNIKIMKKFEHFSNKNKLREDNSFWGLFSIFDEKDRLKITVQKVYRQRSCQQNKFFHGPVLSSVQDAVLSEWGENISLEQAKTLVKEYCHFKEVLNEKTGEFLKILLPTAELTTIEFEELNERVRRWLWDSFNYKLPEPNENFAMNI